VTTQQNTLKEMSSVGSASPVVYYGSADSDEEDQPWGVGAGGPCADMADPYEEDDGGHNDDPLLAALQQVQWERQDGEAWMPLPNAVVARLRHAMLAGASECNYTLGSILAFRVHMATLVQTNVVTGTVTRLRVMPTGGPGPAPTDTAAPDDDPTETLELAGTNDGSCLDMAAVTRWEVLGPGSTAEDQTCCVCLEALFGDDPIVPVVRLGRCANHAFHAPCITAAFAVKPKCPWCGHVYAPMQGTQPNGTMRVTVDREVVLAGHPDAAGAIVIQYDIPDGVQGSRHPHPGKRFTGAHWTAFLPNTPRGREVCSALKAAFRARLIFHLGWSVTRAQDDCVAWGTIHHKTSKSPGAFGYPDPGYLDRVTDELAQKGLTKALSAPPADPVADLLRSAAERRALVTAVETS
jgi:deltex